MALRSWVIGQTRVVADDSPRYLDAARRLESEGLRSLQTIRFHPGFPAAALGMERALHAMGCPAGPVTWDLAGQLVAMVFAALATGLAWWFAAKAFDTRIATLGILVFTVTREWTTVGSDALSDTMSVAFQMLCVLLAMLSEERLRERIAMAVVLAGGAGLAAGCAYLVRPEGILVLIAIGCLLISAPLRRRGRWSAALTAAVAAVAGAVAVGGPYALYVGALTPKHDVGGFFRGLAGYTGALPLAMLNIRQTAPYVVADEFVGGLHVVTAVLIGLWVMTWVGARVVRVRLPQRVQVFPTPQAGLLMATVTIVNVGMMLARHVRWGHVSSRYFMFPSLLLAPLAGATVWILWRWCRLLSRRLGPRRRYAKPLYWVFIAGLVVALAVHAGRPLHAQFAYARSAGEFVHSISRPGDLVLTNNRRAFYYTDRPGRVVWQRHFRAEAVGGLCQRDGYAFATIAVDSDPGADVADPLRDVPGFQLLRSFRSSDTSQCRWIHVYRYSADPRSGTRH